MPRYAAEDLIRFAEECCLGAGMENRIAKVLAEVLVEADLLGHATHGLQLLEPYLKEMDEGKMTLTGGPEVVRDWPGSLLWDGDYLPGPYLVVKALEEGLTRIKDQPVVSISIRRSHHTACLASYLTRATDHGVMILMYNVAPDHRGVPPFGGKEPVLSPDPIAAGIPTPGDPVLVDISTSVTSVGRTAMAHRRGERMPGKWLMDAEGNATDDPAVHFDDPPGTILPLGQSSAGHKGYALCLLVEAMASAVAGFGRKDEPERWGCNVFIQLIDPEGFGGLEAFRAETGFVTRACVESAPLDPAKPVRLPGQAGLARKRDHLANGVLLAEGLSGRLQDLAEARQVRPPEPID